MTKFKVSLGDWSKDGHNISEDVIFEANKSIKQIQDAYKAFVKKHKIALHEGYYKEWMPKGTVSLCCEYEDYVIPDEIVAKLQALKISFNNFENSYTKGEGLYVCGTDIAFLFLEMAKTELPGLKYKNINDDIPYINAHWIEGFNCSFAYGCYGG